MIFLQKFLTNWRAQRGKFLTISLMFRDFSCETLCVDKIISPPRGILCVDKNRLKKMKFRRAAAVTFFFLVDA